MLFTAQRRYWLLLLCLLVISTSAIHGQGHRRAHHVDQVQEIMITRVKVVNVTSTRKSDQSTRYQRQKGRIHKQIKADKLRHESKPIKERILKALWGFNECRHPRLNTYEDHYRKVPVKQQQLLDHAVGYGQIFRDLASLKSVNRALCHEIVDAALQYYDINRKDLEDYIKVQAAENRVPDSTSVSQALLLFVRDWAVEGENERRRGFECIRDHLTEQLKDFDHDRTVEILIPGSGLGSLAHEIADMDARYSVITNEWSAYVNAAYHLFNVKHTSYKHKVIPFIESWSHRKTTNELKRHITFPDTEVDPSKVFHVEGDFTKAFKDSSAKFDVVITFWFIDTARNIVDYFQTIKDVLKPGGIWINLGPLLYSASPWVQLSLEEVALVTEAMGFEYLKTSDHYGTISLPGREIRGMHAQYNFNASSLGHFAYEAQFWVARKLSTGVQ